jgi:hypothetical protein
LSATFFDKVNRPSGALSSMAHAQAARSRARLCSYRRRGLGQDQHARPSHCGPGREQGAGNDVLTGGNHHGRLYGRPALMT